MENLAWQVYNHKAPSFCGNFAFTKMTVYFYVSDLGGKGHGQVVS